MADGDISPTVSELLLLLLILISLVFDFVLHRLEHWVNHRHHHLQAVLKVLYRELMVLGLVSFSFIIYEVTRSPEPSIVLSFEFAHIFIFLLAIFYTIVVLSSMYASLRLSYRWKHMEQIDLIHYLHMKEEYTRLRLRVHKHRSALWRGVRWWFPNFKDLWRYWQLHEMMAFHDIRFQFIYYRNLPEHFRFSSFLRRIKALTFTHLVESHWSLWIIFLVLVVADIIRRKFIGDPSEEGRTDLVESIVIIVAAGLLMICVQILALKIRKIYWELTKHPRVYYEGLQAEDVAEELDAEERRRASKTDGRSRSRSSNSAADNSGDIADDEGTDPSPPADDTAETEMAHSMHLPIPRPLGTPNPDGASPIYRSVAPGTDRTTLSRSADAEIDTITPDLTRANGGKSEVEARKQASVTFETLHAEDMKSSLDDMAIQHALECKVHSPGAGSRSGGPSLDLGGREDSRQVGKDTSDKHRKLASPRKLLRDGLPVTSEVRGTAVRHSLELSRRPGSTELSRPAVANPKASQAKAAVEAARKRSIEKQFGRYSLDSRQPGDVSRPSIDQSKWDATRGVLSPNIISRISSRRASTDDDGHRVSGSEYGRNSADGRAMQRRSIELVAAMPHEELATRHHGREEPSPERDLEAGIIEPKVPEQNPPGLKKSARIQLAWNIRGGNARENNEKEQQGVQHALSRYKSLGFVNATIMKNLEHQQNANNMQPADYPWIVKKLIPRLARVSSPVEKLFWFGSHMFFLWCVEFVLFFSTVLLSASTGTIFLIAIKKDRKFHDVNIAAEVTATVALVFVLVRIAGIIKKYIFILHNASLVPESVAIQAIHNVSKKRRIRRESEDDIDSDLSGSDTEQEDEQSALEKRRVLGRFFRSEAEIGNIPGIDGADTPHNNVSVFRPKRRLALRKLARRRRMARMKDATDTPPKTDGGAEGTPL